MGRLSTLLRSARFDPAFYARIGPPAHRARGALRLREVAMAARDAGRSCFLRPLFDRPRQWAEQRAPRSTVPGQNPSDH